VVIPVSVTSIGEQAFYSCSSLSRVVIPASSVISIGEEAFSGCPCSYWVKKNYGHLNKQRFARGNMENRTIFIAYLITWCAYVVATHAWVHRKRLSVAGVVVAHTVPAVVALTMTYVFLIAGGTTVAQFVAGSEAGMNMWSLWFHLWPILLIGSAVSAVVSVVWTIVACVKKPLRRWLPITLATVVMSVFAFMTVAANFPDA